MKRLERSSHRYWIVTSKSFMNNNFIISVFYMLHLFVSPITPHSVCTTPSVSARWLGHSQAFIILFTNASYNHTHTHTLALLHTAGAFALSFLRALPWSVPPRWACLCPPPTVRCLLACIIHTHTHTHTTQAQCTNIRTD